MRTQLEFLDGKYAGLPDEIMSLTHCLSVKSVYNCLLLAWRVFKAALTSQSWGLELCLYRAS